jgi:hypothetical protein
LAVPPVIGKAAAAADTAASDLKGRDFMLLPNHHEFRLHHAQKILTFEQDARVPLVPCATVSFLSQMELRHG